MQINDKNIIEQGRIYGQYQLRTSGQGRKCAFSHFSTRIHGRTDGPTDRRKKAHTELRVRNLKSVDT